MSPPGSTGSQSDLPGQGLQIATAEPTVLELVEAGDNEENGDEILQIVETDLNDVAFDTSTPPNDPTGLKALVSSNFVDHYG